MSISIRPIISGFHPDPSVCRYDDAYYLVTSSFEYSPGVPMFRSHNLIDWEQIGNVLNRPDQLLGVGLRPSGGVYAPTLRHHAGQFWLITTIVTGAPGQILVTASDPAGPWSEPLSIPDAIGIDPDIAWDDEERCWVTWSGEIDSSHGIVQARLDPDSGELLSEPCLVWSGTGGQYPEAPHLFRHEEYWYLLIAEGGTERGHAVTIARSSRPDGPFEPSPLNPLLTARGTDSPTQNTGHADLVKREDGRWAMVFLGVRSRGFTPWWHVLGRETFAAEITWSDGWPVVGQPLEPSRGDDFVEPLKSPIPLTWVSPNGLPSDLLQREPQGWRITCPGGEAVFIGRRQEHFLTTTRVAVDASENAVAIEFRIDPRHRFGLRVQSGSVHAFATIGGKELVLGERHVGTLFDLELRSETADGVAGTSEEGPDTLVAVVVIDGQPHELGRLDGRYLSTEVAGGFTGRMIGLSASGHGAVFESFEYQGVD